MRLPDNFAARYLPKNWIRLPSRSAMMKERISRGLCRGHGRGRKFRKEAGAHFLHMSDGARLR